MLEPNFRGSVGYGASYEAAGYKEWGKTMQDDLTDGVKWLIDEGVADPSRVCIFRRQLWRLRSIDGSGKNA